MVQYPCKNNLGCLYLDQHPKVKWVHFPGLPSNPGHALATAQFEGKGYGSLLTFGLLNESACFELIRNLKLVSNLANLGDCKTLIIHPWSSQYVGLPKRARIENGVTDDLIRVSVGIEGIDDIIDDFEQALSEV